MLLEFYQGHHVIFILEPWYGRLRAMGPDNRRAQAPPANRVGSPGRSLSPLQSSDTDDALTYDAEAERFRIHNPNPTGRFLYGTQSHPNWTLLETQRDARVAVYVNKRLLKATFSLHPDFSTKDVALLQLTLRENLTYNLLGLYNDKHCVALNHILDKIHSLPHVHVMGGDYNLHSKQWDTLYPTTSPATSLAKVAMIHGALGHDLASPVDEVTHIPDNTNLQGTVIDLIWSNADIATKVSVRATARGLSDHAILDVDIATPEWSLLGDPTIKRGSDDEEVFLDELASALPELLPSEEYPPSDLFGIYPIPTDAATTAATATRLYEAYRSAWGANAKPKRYCGKSAQFWTNDLTTLRKEMHSTIRQTTPVWQRNSVKRKYGSNQRHHPDFHHNMARRATSPAPRKEARSKFKTALRRARNKHMETRIREISEESKRV